MKKLNLSVGLVIITLSFPFIAHGQVSDIDGNIYETVKIGDQTWMTENLKTTKYRDGTTIPLVTNDTVWSSLTTSGYCWYNNDTDIGKNIYGALYNWNTVATGNLCPFGWHVPTHSEWMTLLNKLGGVRVAGKKMKDNSTGLWKNPSTGDTNESGFSAIPGGFRGDSNWQATSDIKTVEFYSIGEISFWWSFTELKPRSAWFWLMVVADNVSSIIFYSGNKKLGLSVRCLMD